METIMQVVNMVASSSIVMLIALNWKRYEELNCVERLGYSLMACLCAAIVIKAVYMFSMDEFKSDVFGILFRVAFVLYLAGSTVKHHIRHSRWAFIIQD